MGRRIFSSGADLTAYLELPEPSKRRSNEKKARKSMVIKMIIDIRR